MFQKVLNPDHLQTQIVVWTIIMSFLTSVYQFRRLKTKEIREPQNLRLVYFLSDYVYLLEKNYESNEGP